MTEGFANLRNYDVTWPELKLDKRYGKQRGERTCMKKSEQRGFVVGLIAFLLLLTIACSKESSKPPAKPPMTEKQSTPSSGTPPASSGGEGTSSDQEGSAETKLIARKWTGDLDGMIQRRLIRVLTVILKDELLR